MTTEGPASPLVELFPALAALPRAALVHRPTPVEPVPGHPELWIKRDDRSAEPLGGNKARALEFLLGDVRSGDEVVTVGATGSSHALATATYARRLGATSTIYRWPQEMNEDAARVAERLERTADRAVLTAHPAIALLRARLHAWRAAWRAARRARAAGHRVHRVPAGGSSPLGVLGHVDAALELAAQVARGECPRPARVVLPLGTGGTAAGLLLGFAIAGLDTRVVAVRVVPRVVARRGRVLALARRTRRLIERLSGTPVAEPSPERILVVHDAFGGAYGRPTARARAAAGALREATGAVADATYASKALAVAMEPRQGPTLFWLTYDAPEP